MNDHPHSTGQGDRAAVRPISFATPAIVCAQSGGATRMYSTTPLAPFEPSLAATFRAAVERRPARTFLAERCGDAWRTITYEAAREIVDRIGQSLVERGLSAERPVMILSGNAIDHALMMLAGLSTGIPIASISTAYSLQSQDYAKLKYIADLLEPGLVYVSDTAPFAKALAALPLANVEIAASRNSANLDSVTLFSSLANSPPGPSLDQAFRSIDASTIAKFLFTSGSTSLPKGVINTHGMLTANQQQLLQVWPFLAEQPLVLVDWLPWNHTFGGNHNFNQVLRHAGTLYIDASKPVPSLIEQTARNVAEISPSVYYNVPAGYAALLPFLERDENLAHSFFKNLLLIFYAGAALPQDLWERLEAVSLRTKGYRVRMTSSWGTTETSPLATTAHFQLERAGNIGVPVPGTELKLVPQGDKIELRVRGPNITPGYWKRPDLTAEAFDDEGFYKPGDAVRFADPADPCKGIIFDGRLAEDFKLLTGTWVQVGSLRVGILAAVSPALQDVVVAGENRGFVGLLAWLSGAGCQKLVGDGAPSSLAELAQHPIVRRHVHDAIARWNETQRGASQRIERILLLPDSPSIDANEITDKGYINQRLALERRQDDVARLFMHSPDRDVILIKAPARS